MPSHIFDSEEFWPAFTSDLRQARARLILQSPFVASRRLKFLSKQLRSLANQGIPVCAFIQEPRSRNVSPTDLDAEASYSLQEFNLAIEMLKSWGVHVNLRRAIHGKFAVIDETILWEGSLNILSHASTSEHMRRWDEPVRAREITNKHELDECGECRRKTERYGVLGPRSKALAGLAKSVALRRAMLSLSQRALARKCRVAHHRIARLESYENISVETMIRIAKGLELEVLLLPRELVPMAANFLEEKECRMS